MGIDITAFGLPILLTSGNTLFSISFLGGFFPLSLPLYYDVNIIGRPKAVSSIPILLGTKHSHLIVPIYLESWGLCQNAQVSPQLFQRGMHAFNSFFCHREASRVIWAEQDPNPIIEDIFPESFF